VHIVDKVGGFGGQAANLSVPVGVPAVRAAPAPAPSIVPPYILE
jgi:hypothetical protein